MVLHGIEKTASKKNYKVIICISDDKKCKEVESVETMINGSVDGILISLAKQTQRIRNLDSKPTKTVSKYKYDLLVEKLEKEREKRRKLLEQFRLVKPSFGKQYYRIDMDVNEFEQLKRILEQNL